MAKTALLLSAESMRTALLLSAESMQTALLLCAESINGKDFSRELPRL